MSLDFLYQFSRFSWAGDHADQRSQEVMLAFCLFSCLSKSKHSDESYQNDTWVIETSRTRRRALCAVCEVRLKTHKSKQQTTTGSCAYLVLGA
jgi:hypothetical protein